MQSSGEQRTEDAGPHRRAGQRHDQGSDAHADYAKPAMPERPMPDDERHLGEEQPHPGEHDEAVHLDQPVNWPGCMRSRYSKLNAQSTRDVRTTAAARKQRCSSAWTERADMTVLTGRLLSGRSSAHTAMRCSGLAHILLHISWSVFTHLPLLSRSYPVCDMRSAL